MVKIPRQCGGRMGPTDIKINAIAFREDGMWVAQCLEYNFGSCAETLEELADELLRQVLDQIEADREAGHEPFYGYKPAPKKFWDMFTAVKAVSKPIKPRKTVLQFLRGFTARPKVETQLFPIAAAA
jgi:hypothetical protein